jgi:hypothetical protein
MPYSKIEFIKATCLNNRIEKSQTQPLTMPIRAATATKASKAQALPKFWVSTSHQYLTNYGGC